MSIDKKKYKSKLSSIFNNSYLKKRKTIKEYSKLSKGEILRLLHSQFTVYGKLRKFYAQQSLDNYTLAKKVEFLEKRIKLLNPRGIKFNKRIKNIKEAE